MSHRVYLSQVLRVAAVLLLTAACSAQDRSGHKPAVQLMTIENSFDGAIFSPDGKRLVGSASGGSWRATAVKFWDISTGDAVLAPKTPGGGIWKIYFSPDAKRRVTHENHTIKIWDLETRKEIRSFATPAFPRCVVFISDGKQLASGHDDNVIRVWDVETSRLVRTLKGHTSYVRSVSFSPDGLRLASRSLDKTIRLWDVQTGKEMRQLTGHTGWVREVAFMPDGRRAISCSNDARYSSNPLRASSSCSSASASNNWLLRLATWTAWDSSKWYLRPSSRAERMI